MPRFVFVRHAEPWRHAVLAPAAWELDPGGIGALSLPADALAELDPPPNAVADGELDISRRAVVQRTVCRGAGFGEIALIRDVPRRAAVTVTALCDSWLYSLEQDVLIETITATRPRRGRPVPSPQASRGVGRNPD